MDKEIRYLLKYWNSSEYFVEYNYPQEPKFTKEITDATRFDTKEEAEQCVVNMYKRGVTELETMFEIEEEPINYFDIYHICKYDNDLATFEYYYGSANGFIGDIDFALMYDNMNIASEVLNLLSAGEPQWDLSIQHTKAYDEWNRKCKI